MGNSQNKNKPIISLSPVTEGTSTDNELQAEKRFIRFLISIDPSRDKDLFSKDLNASEAWEILIEENKKNINEKGYEVEITKNASFDDFIRFIKDPQTVALIWSSHGGPNGRLYPMGNPTDSLSEYFYPSIVNGKPNIILEKPKSENSSYTDMDAREIKPISPRLRILAFFACMVGATDKEIAEKMGAVKQEERAQPTVENMMGLVKWIQTLHMAQPNVWTDDGKKVEVHAAGTYTYGYPQMHPDKQSKPKVRWWSSFDMNDMELEGNNLLGRFLSQEWRDRHSKIGPPASQKINEEVSGSE
jgi:hypothetical protein